MRLMAHAMLRVEQTIFLMQKQKKCLGDNNVFKEVKEIWESDY